MLSAINGDLCLEGKAFDLPQPEENRLSAIYFKSQIHIGVLFFSIMQILHITFPLWRSYLAMQIYTVQKAHFTMKELNGFIVQTK